MDWLKCFHCDKEIEEDENHFTINLHKERVEGGAITVLSADSVKIYCSKCAELYDFDKISVPLKDETIS